jgi:SAM-dependent methyltransferase
MQDYSSPPRFDFATCVFTVLIYLLDDSDLRASMRSVSQALKPGGQLLLDVPSRAVFRGLSFNSESCNRNVQVTPLAGDIFQYVEVSDIKTTQGVETFTDSFKIRYWKSKDVLKSEQEMGLTIEMDFSDDESVGEKTAEAAAAQEGRQSRKAVMTVVFPGGSPPPSLNSLKCRNLHWSEFKLESHRACIHANPTMSLIC